MSLDNTSITRKIITVSYSFYKVTNLSNLLETINQVNYNPFLLYQLFAMIFLPETISSNKHTTRKLFYFLTTIKRSENLVFRENYNTE